MKKLFAMLLALVMTMGLMACGAQPTAANDTDGDAAGEDGGVTDPPMRWKRSRPTAC